MFTVPTVLHTQEVWKTLGSLRKADGGELSAGPAVIAIGPMGGKIIGYYGADHKPIYLGSGKARKLMAEQQSASHKAKLTPVASANNIVEWLKLLGFPALHDADAIVVTPQAGQELLSAFGVKPSAKSATVWRFAVAKLVDHIGKPLVPPKAEEAAWAAKLAAPDVFPDLNTLKEIPAGKAAGSHGNRLFQSPDGKKWLFKTGNSTIARAEEAASRFGLLVLGEGKVQPAKYVKLGGTDGVLLGWLSGEGIEGEYHKPTDSVLADHFEQFVQHEVLDWLISNHDSHAGNFLVENGSIKAIDKGQSWRFLGNDKLSATYKPNASPPVYLRMWQLYAQGKIKGDPVAAARKVFEQIDKISPEHFEQIIGPYVLTRAKEKGESAAALTAKLVARFEEAKIDWSQFLSQVTGKKVDLFAPPQATVQTLEQKPEPITAPAEPAPAPKVPEVPVAKPTIGWPITKGKLTVKSPGSAPPPGVKWPEGYPGDGFHLLADYKGQKYQVAFFADTQPDGSKKFAVLVVYPDGTTQKFDSGNKASDSLYLFHNKLPLDMSATEKKAKGISYPAKKAFGFTTFAEELKQVFGEPPAIAKTVEELKKPQEPGEDNFQTMPETKSGDTWKPANITEGIERLWKLPMGTKLYSLNSSTYMILTPSGIEVYSGFGKDTEVPAESLTTAEAAQALLADSWKVVKPISAAAKEQFPDDNKVLPDNHPLSAPSLEGYPVGTVLSFMHNGLTDKFSKLPAGDGPVWVGKHGGTFEPKHISALASKVTDIKVDNPDQPQNESGVPDSHPLSLHSLSGYPPGTKIFFTDNGTPMQLFHSYQKPGEWLIATVTPPPGQTANHATHITPQTVAMGAPLMVDIQVVLPAAPMPPPPPADTAVAAAPMTAPSVPAPPHHDGKFKKAGAVLVTHPKHLPAAVVDSVAAAFEKAKEWSTEQAGESGNVVGAKPPTWPVWAPPPGVFIEGQHDGKKYWMCVSVAGYKVTGEPAEMLKLTILQEDGSWSNSAYMKSGPSALKDAALGTPLSGMNMDALKGVFKLDKLIFVPGETWQGVTEGKFAPMPPDKPVSKLTPKEKMEPAAAKKMALLALKDVFPDINFSEAGPNVALTVFHASGDHSIAAAQLTAALKQFGIKPKSPMLQTGAGASVTVSAADLKQEVAFSTDVLTALSTGVPEVVKAKALAKSTEQLEKEAKAKQIAAWAKDYPPVTDAFDRMMLAHVQAHVGKFIARKDGDHVLVSADNGKLNGLAMDTVGAVRVDTPLGPMWRVRAEALADALPGKPAAVIDGPDGKPYPKGTTFTTEKVTTPIMAALQTEPAFYKVTAHKTDSTKLVLKVKGTGPEQASKLKEWDAKYKLGIGDSIAVGGSNTLAFIAKTKVDEVWKTEERLNVTLPPAPPPFASMPLPTIGGKVHDGAPGAINTSDLAVMESLVPSRIGHAVRMGKYGVFYGGQVYVRKVTGTDGAPAYEVFGELNASPLAADTKLSAGVFQLKNTTKPSGEQGYDPATGAQLETAEGGRSYNALVGKTEGGAEVRLINKPGAPAMHGNFSIRVPASKDLHTELSRAFTLMGIDPEKALAEPSEEDERMLKKFQVACAATGVQANRQLRGATEAELDKIIGSKVDIDSVSIQQVFEGKQVACVPANEARAHAAGVRFVFSCRSGVTSVAQRLTEGGGLASNRRKILNGISTANAGSLDSDEPIGGNNAVFCRLGNINTTTGWGNVNGDGPKMIFHPRVLNRTDWWAFNHDAYGNTTVPSAKQSDCFGYAAANNEIDFEDGVSQRDLAGIVVQSDEDKVTLIKRLEANGVKDVNGISLDKFILVYSGSSRKVIADKLYGLQPGALP